MGHAVAFAAFFVDACFDVAERTGGLGGVLADPNGSPVAWFEQQLSSEVCSTFMREDQQHAIGELEALAVLAVLRLWRGLLKSKHCVCFVDNEGSRFAILRGYSRNEMISRLPKTSQQSKKTIAFFAGALELRQAAT